MEFLSSLFHPFIAVIQFMLENLYLFTGLFGFENYGIAIILLTILIKVCLYPLTVKQVRSMKGMQELQPKMKKLQEKYKNNPQMMQQKIGELYKEAGVNPLAGCLPLLIQMPILMGMFYALQGYAYSGTPSFLWLTSLSEPDPHYILPALSALSTWFVQRQTSTEMNQQMKIMMIIMPIFIGWISLSFASGLVLYWVTMNLVQIVHQWWMYRNEDVTGKKGVA